MERMTPLFAAALLLIATAPAWGQTLPMASPEDVGLSSEALDELSKVLQKHVDENHMAGVTALIARRGKIGYFKSFGKRDVDAGDPMQNDTIYRIYSMTKPITSVAVMMLFEEGRFGLDDPVSKYIPELGGLEVVVKTKDPDTGESTYSTEPSKRDMTVRDLLRHTSGLTYGRYGIAELDAKYREKSAQRRDGTLADMTAALGTMPLRYQPGTTWHYSVSTDVLGRFVEVISGTTFDKFLEERIFKPLRMKDSGFHVPQEDKDRLAGIYGRKADMTIQPLPAGRGRDYLVPSKYFSGGGGLVSTTEDYFRFCQMMLNGGELDGVRILKSETVDLMTRNHLGDVSMGWGLTSFGFGLGYLIYPDLGSPGTSPSEGTYSWGGAASTSFWIDPVKEVIGILMIQIMPEVRTYGQEFQRLTYRAIND